MELATYLNTGDYSQGPDILLAQACAAGDGTAMQILYERYAPQMLTVCRRYTSSRDEALDFLHDGFIKVFEKIGSFKEHGSLQGWISRVIVNYTLDQLRKKTRIKEVAFEEDIDYDTPDETSEPDEYSIDAEQLLSLLQQLPQGYRIVLNLFVFEQLSHDEIAAQLGVSAVTSRTQLSKARKYLKKLINAQKR